jgi:cation diffusion facilitator CzcD-associated flavoprotein CzcO
MIDIENVIVGAGPYGLSIAAHFRANNIEALIIGRPMASWRDHMPVGMILKSETFASNLSDPQRRYTFENFYKLRGTPYRAVGNPLSIGDFIDYADWFREGAAPEIRDLTLRNLRRRDNGFELVLDDGSRVRTKRVILATGYVNFQHTPQALHNFPAELVSHTSHHRDLKHFAGKDVTVIGRGQSGLESAALLHEQGADVRILARADRVEWNSDPNAARSLIARLRRPEAGLGAGWYSLAVSELPRLFHRYDQLGTLGSLVVEGARRRQNARADVVRDFGCH